MNVVINIDIGDGWLIKSPEKKIDLLLGTKARKDF